jgi:hypothetical protein
MPSGVNALVVGARDEGNERAATRAAPTAPGYGPPADAT